MSTQNCLPSFGRAVFAAAFAAGALLAAPAVQAATHVLRFVATPANLTAFHASVILDSPLLNGKPTLKPIIAQYWTSTYNDHPVGIRYDPGVPASAARWVIYNEDGADIALGAQFNVLIPATAGKVDATPLNSKFNLTAIPTAKGKPDAMLFFTHVWNPHPTVGGGIFAPNQSLSYPADGSLLNKWYIYNQNPSLPALAAGYFIFDAASLPAALGAVKLRHTSAAGNIINSRTEITDAGALTDPANVVFFTPLSISADKVFGIYHDGSKWSIFNEDGTDFGPGEGFNVLMFPKEIP